VQGWGDDWNMFEADSIEALVDCALDIGDGIEFGSRAGWRVVCFCVDAMESADQGVDA